MLSVGVLSYTLTDNHKALTHRALESLKDYADELIVVENGGSGKYDADVFVKLKKNSGFTHGVNTILKVAGGDYIAIVSNDISLLTGDPHDLCIANTVTSPKVENQPYITGMAGSFFVIPKTIYDKIGGLDEGMTIYYSDTEYIDRLHDNNIPIKQVESVVIWHEINQTAHMTPDMQVNDATYYENKRNHANGKA